MLKSATAFILFPLKPLNSRRRCTGMRAWRTIPQIAGCASRSKACSGRNPAPRSLAVAHPATSEDRVEESYSTNQKMNPPRKAGLLSRLRRDDRLPNLAEVLLSKVEERLRNPRSRFQSLD